MEFEVRIYGPSSQWTGFKWEVINPEDNNKLMEEGYEFTEGEARIQANRFVDTYNPQPLAVYRRIVPEVS